MTDDFERALNIFQEFGPERAIPVTTRWKNAFPDAGDRQLLKWEHECHELERFAYGLGVQVTGGTLSDADAAAQLSKRYPNLSRQSIHRTISQACYFAAK